MHPQRSVGFDENIYNLKIADKAAFYTISGSLCLIVEARLVVLENCLRRTEEVLVMGRLAQRFAESAQQMVGTQSAGIERSLGEKLVNLRHRVEKVA